MKQNKSVEETKLESAELQSEFETALESDFIDIAKMTSADIDTLIDILAEASYEIASLNSRIQEVDTIIYNGREKITKLEYLKSVTPEDISSDIWGTKLVMSLFLQSYFINVAKYSLTDELTYNKAAIIIIFLNYLAFRINRDYITSNFQKRRAKKKLALIRENLALLAIDKSDLESAKAAYNKVLEYAIKKLYEVAPKEINGVPFNDYLKVTEKERIMDYAAQVKAEAKQRKRSKQNNM